MKVIELLDILKDVSQDAEVVLSKDSEGNAYHRLTEQGISINRTYNKNDGYYIEVIYEKELTEELKRHRYTEEDVLTVEDGGVECIVFYP